MTTRTALGDQLKLSRDYVANLYETLLQEGMVRRFRFCFHFQRVQLHRAILLFHDDHMILYHTRIVLFFSCVLAQSGFLFLSHVSFRFSREMRTSFGKQTKRRYSHTIYVLTHHHSPVERIAGVFRSALGVRFALLSICNSISIICPGVSCF